ncbi:MAG TPA: DUF2203 domain-containing protein [Dongiaceae bacterium]|nr:DUF2203 domain-containing protein [Dongiaceae bacterium]
METPSRAQKIFTIDEARALLPVIQPEVEALVRTYREIRSEIEATAGTTGLTIDSPDLAGHLEARGVVARLFEQARDSIAKVHRHGCVVNGPEAGLIDFPCLYNNEIVFLCWQYGETTIEHWHRIPDGFAGRRPLLAADPATGDDRVH